MSEQELVDWLENDVKDSSVNAESNKKLYDKYAADPESFINEFKNIKEKYQNKVNLNNLANEFAPDWDGLVQYLIYEPNLNNIAKKAEKAGIENVD
jgi:hypothetical protein